MAPRTPCTARFEAKAWRSSKHSHTIPHDRNRPARMVKRDGPHCAHGQNRQPKRPLVRESVRHDAVLRLQRDPVLRRSDPKRITQLRHCKGLPFLAEEVPSWSVWNAADHQGLLSRKNGIQPVRSDDQDFIAVHWSFHRCLSRHTRAHQLFFQPECRCVRLRRVCTKRKALVPGFGTPSTCTRIAVLRSTSPSIFATLSLSAGTPESTFSNTR